jgi:hypothetical protein
MGIDHMALLVFLFLGGHLVSLFRGGLGSDVRKLVRLMFGYALVVLDGGIWTFLVLFLLSKV